MKSQMENTDREQKDAGQKNNSPNSGRGDEVVADGAGDLITAATYAITAGMSVDQLAHTWAPYLTMAEALKLAAQTYTRDITKLSCCAA